MKRLAMGMAASFVIATATAPASAGPELAPLRVEVAAARLASRASFVAVDSIRAAVVKSPPAHERRALVARQLKALGPDALLPMLALLGLDPKEMQGLAEPARQTLLVGLLEAVGQLRDARSAPVLRSWVEGREADALVVETAAKGLGKLCRDEDVSWLVARAAPGGARELAAIAGLGECRRPESARHLAARLDAGPDAATAEALADALGSAGSSWALRALATTRPAADLEAVRAEASRSLAAALPRYDGRASEAIARAIRMVEDR